MLEACSNYVSEKELRIFFATILSHSDPKEPVELWQAFKETLSYDISYRFQDNLDINIENYVLTLINNLV